MHLLIWFSMVVMTIFIVAVCTISLCFNIDYVSFILLIIFSQLGNFLRFFFVFRARFEAKNEEFKEEIIGY